MTGKMKTFNFPLDEDERRFLTDACLMRCGFNDFWRKVGFTDINIFNEDEMRRIKEYASFVKENNMTAYFLYKRIIKIL